MSLQSAIWPVPELGQLLEALGGKSCPLPVADPERIAAWMEAACPAMGFETGPVAVWGNGMEATLRAAAPAAVPVGDNGWVALLEISAGIAVLAAPNHSTVRIPFAELTRVLSAPHWQPFEADVEKMLHACGIAEARRGRARASFLRNRIRAKRVATVWSVRTPPGGSFWRQLTEAGVVRRAVLLIAVHMAELFLWIFAWFLLGGDALQGRVEESGLIAWILALASIVPFHMATIWLQGAIAISGGGLLRQRLLEGILHLPADTVRKDGAGRFLSRALDASLIESLALSGGMMSGLALFEIVLAGAVIATGAGALLHVAALSVCLIAAIFLAWRYHGLRTAWTTTRLTMTHDLVERMTGHRTRLAQENPAAWHLSEDQSARDYVLRSAAMDRGICLLTGVLPRSWLLLGIAALAPAFLDERPSQAALAISLGSILLAWQALRRLTSGLANLSGALIAWGQVAPLFHAARSGANGSAVAATGGGAVVVDARNLTFQYDGQGRRVLDGVDLQIRRGDWVLLEGESGGGKSTLVSALSGLRDASGLLLLGGLDRQTLGERQWRARVAASLQYQENHVLSGTFAFNLLMGRAEQAGATDLAEAQQICRELGLGPLLERMPAGLMQMVGETGWQLSQGERSRMFIARALLQNPELVILDESFGALDPENLRQSLECVLRRAKTLLVVAHP